MRRLAIALLCAAGSVGVVGISRAQGWWWQHERLQTGMYAVSADPSEVYINSRGDVCYYAAATAYDYFDGYRNRENLSDWLGPDRAARTRGINERGQVLYEAIHRAPWGGQMLSLFVDRKNWTESLVGPGMSYDIHTWPQAGQRRLDDQGVPVFSFTAEYPGGRQVLYQGDRAVSDEVLSGETRLGRAHVNGAGQVLWGGRGSEFGGTQITFLDTRPLSYEVLGPGYGTGALQLNERGDVLWGGVNIDGYSDFFINEVNYSRSHFGNVGYNMLGQK